MLEKCRCRMPTMKKGEPQLEEQQQQCSGLTNCRRVTQIIHDETAGCASLLLPLLRVAAAVDELSAAGEREGDSELTALYE